jgi:hypothetical protein
MLTSSANPATLNQPVTFTAQVAVVAPGTDVPTGNVTFTDGASVLGTVALDNAGQATLTTAALAVGPHTITAVYNGDAAFTTSTSAALAQRVAYAFSGFSSPVDAAPIVNSAKAGQTIPLKWRFTDANGVPVTNLTTVQVTVASLTCASGTPTDAIEQYATSESALQNLGNGYYQLNWKSPKSYAGWCKTLNLDVGEGSYRTALFQFK